MRLNDTESDEISSTCNSMFNSNITRLVNRTTTMSQLSPTFDRGGGGGGGFFEGTMGVCNARAWLNSSSSDEDGEADNGESSGERSKGFPR